MPKKPHNPPPKAKPKATTAKANREPSRKQRRVAVADRRTEVAALYAKGYYQAEIARALGIDKAQVCRDIKTITDEWAEDRVENLQIAKERELAKLEQIEREAWHAWDRSQLDAVTEKRTAGELETGTGAAIDLPATKLETTRTGQVGDPRFLAEVQKVVDRRCKLLGLDAPAKIQSTGDFQTVEQMVAEIIAAVSE